MDIFEEKEEEQKLLLKKYNRQINATRIITFGMALMAMVGAIISMSISAKFGYSNSSAIWLQIGVLAVVLLIVGLSYVKPFIPLVLLTSFTLFGAVAYSITVVTTMIYGSTSPGLVAILSILVQLVINVFMIKGTIAAWKWQRLKKQMIN